MFFKRPIIITTLFTIETFCQASAALAGSCGSKQIDQDLARQVGRQQQNQMRAQPVLQPSSINIHIPPQVVQYGNSSQPPPAYDGDSEMEVYEVPVEKMQNLEIAARKQYSQLDAVLENLEIVVLVDRSWSQSTRDNHVTRNTEDVPGMFGPKWRRWDSTLMVANYLFKTMLKYDSNHSIPFIFFGADTSAIEIKNEAEILPAFNRHRPAREDTTNMYGALEKAFREYRIPAHKRGLYIVLTDGEPDPGQEHYIEKLIQEKITDVDPKGERLNVLFIRMGDNDLAKKFLERMDDSPVIGGNVDTKTDNLVHEMGPHMTLLNAILEHKDHEYQNK